jgi:two-component system alkaline phosphatase synthesis response regulator PhoP
MKKKIAIVEDDDLIRAMIQLNLEKNGYSSSAFPSAEEAQQFSDSEFYDLIICDVLLPGISGFEFLKKLREIGDNTPVLMLTVRSDVSSRLQAFNIGTDDYLVKPFNMHELTARVKALIRRSQGERRIPASKILIINGFKVNSSSRESESSSGTVILSEKEINLLIYLIENSHHELSRADILEEVWGMDVAPTPRTIDNFILKFRRLFEDNPDKPRHFISIRGKGYTYEP